jgi:hypothetical protein
MLTVNRAIVKRQLFLATTSRPIPCLTSSACLESQLQHVNLYIVQPLYMHEDCSPVRVDVNPMHKKGYISLGRKHNYSIHPILFSLVIAASLELVDMSSQQIRRYYVVWL